MPRNEHGAPQAVEGRVRVIGMRAVVWSQIDRLSTPRVEIRLADRMRSAIGWPSITSHTRVLIHAAMT